MASPRIKKIKLGCRSNIVARLSALQKISFDTLEKAPWVGSLRTNEDQEDVYSCGAVLIGPRLALTAAHCIQDSVHTDSGFDETWNTFSVRFEQKEFGSFKYVNVKAFVKPKDGFERPTSGYQFRLYFLYGQLKEYTGVSCNQIKEYKKNKNFAYDIALLILEDIIYDIPPVCLPSISDNFPYHDVYPKLNTSMYSFFKSDDTFEKLQVVDFPMAPTSPDIKHLEGGSSMPANRFPLKGSSGSPIISTINGKATLIGVLSGAGITGCAKCWDIAMANKTATKDNYADCKSDCFRTIFKFS